MKTLLLKFAGPLQSWGTDSKFETRYTDSYPSKSGVLGMVAASLGFSRDDERIQELNRLNFGVRIDQPGELLRDYHTVRKNKLNGDFDRTYVTNRFYLQDAVFVVGLSSDNDTHINEIANAIKYPYYQLFLGRRSNPITADFILDVYDLDLLSSLMKVEWQAANWFKKKNREVSQLEIQIDGDLVDGIQGRLVKDRIISLSQKERRYGNRLSVRKYISVESINRETHHDAFNGF